MKIGILDYGSQSSGSGNLNSVKNILNYIGCKSLFIKEPEEINSVDKIILPGVGASKHVIQSLKNKYFDEALNDFVIKKGKHFLGICVGMQVLANHLTEFGDHNGLGWIKGKVVNIKQIINQNKSIPHMGWSDLIIEENDNLKLNNYLKKYRSFYFAHSYTLIPEDHKIINCKVNYGSNLVAGISFDNIAAFQFHPEKSQLSGESFFKWFIDWSP